ncbi:olfactory receptor 6M1-like [Bombina bombina]|uniref:olfactory receptor 6M1-like n=1 Tax=Bombina bombina TaxID=8345 RepID=UPI00235A4E76|nr:olfactory receptor 6M1-like [Bombina bombina]
MALDGINRTLVTEFILLGFPFISDVAFVFVFLVLLSYLFTMVGNLLILALVSSDHRLQSPMYFFLGNLSFLDVCFINTTVPKMLSGFLPGGKTISLNGCLAQSFSFFLFGVANFLLLSVMSFDRYVAICHPLHYSVIMHQRLCIQLMVGVWLVSFICILTPSVRIISLKFCSRLVNHFFCDVFPMFINSCTDTTSIQLLEILISSSVLLSSLLVTLISYIYIVNSILKIPSTDGRKKALSTCSSHALVVTLAYGSCIFTYAKPAKGRATDYDKKVALLITVVVPLLNPYIYTLRNQKVREILRTKLFMKK